MTDVTVFLAVALQFAAIGALVVTGRRRGHEVALLAHPRATATLRLLAGLLLPASLWLLLESLGAEIGVPIFLGLLGLVGLANLLLSALSRRGHAAATLLSAAASLLAAALLAAAA